MNAEEYQKLKEIFQSAVEVTGDERERFLDESCNGDTSMRREVERLLRSHDSDFLEATPVGTFAETISESSSRSGQRIGHYNVQKKIGSGGMGDVYLAVDGKLGRRVAIKILPEEFTTDEDRLDRFQLEARSASSLSHPNILTIHEIGEWEGTHYIATEYVEGETLRQRLARGRQSVGESLEIGVQLFSAIAAAHEAGICHRDIKPENVMIRRDGIVKVVDFGLAKLSMSPFRSDHSLGSYDEPTVKIVRTEPGVIMGTVQYMSPEQTRGLPTDERSDIWSLGCVLYEMLAGKPPFSGESSADLIAEIVKTHPPALSTFDSEVPERLDEIVAKTLEKNPDERYQTAKDLSIDLKRLKRRFEVEDILERSNPSLSGNSDDKITAVPNIISTRKGPKDLTEVNSAEYLYWGIKAHRWTTVGIVLFILSLLGGTALLVRQYWRKSEIVQQALVKNPTIERLTADGKTQFASISSDGRFLGYVRAIEGGASLWVKQIATNSSVQLINPGVVKQYDYLTFSPEGNFIYFTGTNESAAPTRSIFRVPTIGGPLVEVLKNAGLPSFSPDGSQIVFLTEEIGVDGKPIGGLDIIDVDGKNRRRLASSEREKAFYKPAWSPNGKLIACGVVNVNDLTASIALIDAATGATTGELKGDWSEVRDLVWQQNMSAVILTGLAKQHIAGGVQIWEVSIPNGEVRQLSQGIGHYLGTSITNDGKKLTTVLNESRTSIWVSPNAEVQNADPITSGNGRHGGVVWSKDQKLIFTSAVSGTLEMWLMNADGTGAKQLTYDNDKLKAKLNPTTSPEGRHIIYQNGDPAGEMTIWRMEIDGSKATQLTTGPFDIIQDFTPDGKWMIYISGSRSGFETRKIPIDGGEALPVNAGSLGSVRISPDERFFGGIIADGSLNKLRVGIVAVDNGKLIREFDIPEALLANYVEWTPDGKSVMYLDATGNLWKQSISGGSPKKITDYKENGILSWNWSPDGKQLVLLRREYTGDAVSLSGY